MWFLCSEGSEDLDIANETATCCEQAVVASSEGPHNREMCNRSNGAALRCYVAAKIDSVAQGSLGNRTPSHHRARACQPTMAFCVAAMLV